MKYSISNIAWDKQYDFEMYSFLAGEGIGGVEIAPTRLFENPYLNLEKAQLYANMLKNRFGLEISSMQSVLYGVEGNIFEEADAQRLTAQLKAAMDFACAMGIKNICFGSPKNRSMPQGKSEDDVLEFFHNLGEYALTRNTVLAIEPVAAVYGTNFLNGTKETCEFCRRVDSEGVKVNMDFGTILCNRENPHLIKTYKTVVNHIHLSAPQLEYIQHTKQHDTLKKVLDKIEYDRYLSIEMKNHNNIDRVKQTVLYLKENF
ncbi:MAG: sugar phosphate isomerase/epimerase, partial [Oscillospiraceae bacterium]|nr:sugar phosphate isomerase/epimerase [Oscillospiraceae bacterium]